MEAHDSPRPSQYKEYWERVKRVEGKTFNRIIVLGMFLAAGLLYFLPSKIIYRTLAFGPVFLLIFLLGEEAASSAARRMREEAGMLLASVRHALDEWQEGASLDGETWKSSRQAHQNYNELNWFRRWCDAIALRGAAETRTARIKRKGFNSVLLISCMYSVASAVGVLVFMARDAVSHGVAALCLAIPPAVIVLIAAAEAVVGAMAIHKYRAGLRIFTIVETLGRIGRLKEQEVEEELRHFAEAQDELRKGPSPQNAKDS